MRLAAIDIGSNAARLLIAEAVTDKETSGVRFNKLNLVRVPLRLGFDVFEKGEISKEKRGMLLQTMKAYSHLINAYGVKQVIVCATSAMRDAANSSDIIRKVKMETGLEIEIISGELEASIIYENHVAENMDTDHSYLYIDVGGGSTELTFFADGKLIFKESFNIGTIRLLKDLVSEEQWDLMKDTIKVKTRGYKKIAAIGTGGNINKIFSLSKKKDGRPLTIDLLKDYYKELSSYKLEDRIKIYNLRADRADVIVPALLIYINVLRWADSDEIYVPKIGLADGLIQHLYEELHPKVQPAG
ncbi:MAG: exopolyphosphatase [Chitinophagaceae bacterium]|jgi:exopolyphosphatase/guanosine-5'-triphosphate,3'-diphosphate pyrophosphatase|nr:exopolyphosphatase [Chitinophagaceae bacterium]MCE2973647.1 exopolyphosphatase [Sediminibacterium sp.]MCA6466957.1 exopolyphosphatase [Chitinophagaceae bacterium]MCA6468932.1 exopolyphosphatase [Chitinophagaceae bacterium]MCA6473951.1 exopolyphosphatase [Chitinophagaceae bacterium]